MNRGFLYGDGFFESFKVVNGIPVFWKYHFDRLIQTIDYLGFNQSYSENELILKIKDYIEEVGLINGRLRVTFYREGIGKYLPESNAYNLDFQSNPSDSTSFESIEFNKLYVSPILIPKHEIGNYKLIAKPLQIKAAIDAHENGAEEAVILNDQNEIAEGMTGNVVLVKDNQLFTPPLSSGCLAGTLRALLLKELNNIREKVLSKKDLETADAIMFTNAARGLMVVQQTARWLGYEALLTWLNQEMLNSIQDFEGTQP